ncbi:MAG: transglutaminase family protein [Methyloceanibacter sp.]|nr:transglutaminase family protein [Methyloceanibacter sp.]
MLIRIEHTTTYKYTEPLLATTQYLRMTPLSGRTQAVESWSLICPGATATPWQDQYGNACHTLTVNKPVNRLGIRVSGLVRTRDTSGVVGVASPELPVMLYLRQTPATAAVATICDLANASRGKAGRDRIDVLHDIMLRIAEAVAYKPGETHVHTTGAEALEQGSGVCQDHAHIFCAAARALDIPSRYVSGYMTQGVGHDAHTASHAWAEAFVDSLGWVGFDPTNRSCPDESYVRTAIGLDYSEAGPMRGVRAGGGDEEMSVHVSFPNQQ